MNQHIDDKAKWSPHIGLGNIFSIRYNYEYQFQQYAYCGPAITENLQYSEAIDVLEKMIEWIKKEEAKKYAVGSEKYEEAKNALSVNK